MATSAGPVTSKKSPGLHLLETVCFSARPKSEFQLKNLMDCISQNLRVSLLVLKVSFNFKSFSLHLSETYQFLCEAWKNWTSTRPISGPCSPYDGLSRKEYKILFPSPTSKKEPVTPLPPKSQLQVHCFG